MIILLICYMAAAAEVTTVIIRAKRIDIHASGALSIPVERATSAVTDALVGLPLVTVRGRGENDGELPQIRGEAPSDSRWFLESVPLFFDGINGGVAGIIPPESLRGLDLFTRGVPTHLAADGLGAGVQMRLRPPETRTIATGIRLGSFGSRRVASEAAVPGASVHLVYHEGAGNFRYLNENGTPFNLSDDTNGYRQFANFRRLTVLPQYLSKGILGELGGELRLFGLFSNGESGVPGPSSSPDGGSLRETDLMVSARLILQWQNLGWDWDAFGINDDSDYRPGDGNGTRSTPLRVKSRRYGVGIRTSQKRGRNVPKLADGLQFTVRPQWEEMDLVGPIESGTRSKFFIPVGVSHTSRWDSVELTPAVVYHRVAYLIGDNRDLVSPRISLLWKAPQWRRTAELSSSVGGYFRHPGLGELYGEPRVLSGNPTLQPERSWKAEIEWKDKLARSVSYGLTHFQSFAYDRIVFVENAQGVMSAQNVGRAWMWGTIGQLWARYQTVTAEFSIAQMNSQNQTLIPSQQGNQLPIRPQVEVKTGVRWNSGPWTARASHTIFGPMYLDLANRHEVLTTHGLDIGLGFKTPGGGEWNLDAYNLLDSILATQVAGGYRFDNVPSGVPGYPSPGRRIYLSWRIVL